MKLPFFVDEMLLLFYKFQVKRFATSYTPFTFYLNHII